MAGGRPTKYRKEMCEEVIRFMAQGFSKAECSAHLGISEETFHQWKKSKPEFSEAVKEGSRQSSLWWAKIGMAGMTGKVPGFNATVWIFNMKNRHGWADKTEVAQTVEQTIQGDLTIRPQLSPEEWAKIFGPE